VSHVYCPECGFQSPAAVNYCARCGALLAHDTGGETTMSLAPEELRDEEPSALDDTLRGTALVVRVGGGLAGERFALVAERTLIGRSPECDVFLDDVTVSRAHAVMERRSDGSFFVRDVGSLNGTYVNGEQVDETTLATGDEVQIGRFKLTFFAAGE